MHTRGRAAAVVVVVVALLTIAPASTPAGAAGMPAFTRVRLTVTSSSDWATVSLRGVSVLDQQPVSVAPGGEVVKGSRGFSFRTPTPTAGAVAVVDAVLEVASTATPVLRVAKGDLGEVNVTLDRTNTSNVLIATLATGPGKMTGGHVDRALDRAALVGESLSIAPVDPRRLVLAFYYPWFRAGSFDSGLWYDRPSSAFATDDPASVTTMVEQAQAAGINGFIASWNGSSTTSPRFDLLAEVAAEHPGFSIAPYLELKELQEQSGATNVNAITTAAAAALSRSAQSSYLKVAGRPVLFVYGTWTLQPSQWQTVLANLAGQGYQPFAIGDGSDPAFGFDGFHLYNPNGMEASALRTFDWTTRAPVADPARSAPRGAARPVGRHGLARPEHRRPQGRRAVPLTRQRRSL